MLYSQRLLTSPSAQQPVLVWLHGLLGSGEDWLETIHALPDYSHLVIDLPGHGGSQAMRCEDLPACAQQVVDTIAQQLGNQQPVVLIGYSLGARVAMVAAESGKLNGLNLQAIVLESGNAGLANEPARVARIEHDKQWAERFAHEPLETVLNAWYQQPVFGSLDTEQRQMLIKARAHNSGEAIAHMLAATSLGTQPNLLAKLQSVSLPMLYICGDKDEKFMHLAQGYGLPTRVIPGAGHNVHKEQPNTFAALIHHFITTTMVGCLA
ncbi:MAG: 2-succinyl-6-hydroxy-2,4-cyclohexadiene-1-carboxylate synthase [Vibrio sp.]